MSIPNMITLVRIVLTPMFVRLYLEGETTSAMVLLALAALSDLLDGAIARRFNMITKLGKALDPVADKLLQLAMMLCLVSGSPAVWTLLVLHVLREGFLAVLGLLVYRRSGEVFGSRWYGKLCTGMIYTVLGAALLFPEMPEGPLNLGLMLCALLILFCVFRYGVEYIRILRDPSKIKKPT